MLKHSLGVIQLNFIYAAIIFMISAYFINNHTVFGNFQKVSQLVQSKDDEALFKQTKTAIKVVQKSIIKQKNSALYDSDDHKKSNETIESLYDHLFFYGKILISLEKNEEANKVFSFIEHYKIENQKNDIVFNKHLLHARMQNKEYLNKNLQSYIYLIGENFDHLKQITQEKGQNCQDICLWLKNNILYAGARISKNVVENDIFNNFNIDGITTKSPNLNSQKMAQYTRKIASFYRDLGIEFYPVSIKFLEAAYSFHKHQAILTGSNSNELVNITTLLGITHYELSNDKLAEKFLLSALHMEEKTKGMNEPLLGFHIKLLINLYKKQNRLTEATALEHHANLLMEDNKEYSFTNSYAHNAIAISKHKRPNDLISAYKFNIPLAKASNLDEMKIRAVWNDKTAVFPTNLKKLMSFCSKKSGQYLSLRSGYRSVATQKTIYDKVGYKGTVAVPGHSEHHSGLAIDINVNERFMQESDPAYKCFSENAHLYGLVLSFPPGNIYLDIKESFEPWHWRFIGKYAANLYVTLGPENKPREFLTALPCYMQIEEKKFDKMKIYQTKEGFPTDITNLCNFTSQSTKQSKYRN